MLNDLIGSIEKLITERGSAVILKERLALIRDLADALEKKVVELEKENAKLTERVRGLEAEVSYNHRYQPWCLPKLLNSGKSRPCFGP